MKRIKYKSLIQKIKRFIFLFYFTKKKSVAESPCVGPRRKTNDCGDHECEKVLRAQLITFFLKHPNKQEVWLNSPTQSYEVQCILFSAKQLSLYILDKYGGHQYSFANVNLMIWLYKR